MNANQVSTTAVVSLPGQAIASDLRHAFELVAAAATALHTLVRQWLYRVRYRHELAGLSDRQLADMGIGRHRLKQEISKPFWIG